MLNQKISTDVIQIEGDPDLLEFIYVILENTDIDEVLEDADFTVTDQTYTDLADLIDEMRKEFEELKKIRKRYTE